MYLRTVGRLWSVGRQCGATRRTAMAVCHLYLMGGFELREREVAVELPLASQRVLAFVALQRRQVARSVAAGTLWPESTEARAAANLRSALWRLRRPGVEIVRATPTHLVLDGA